MSQALAPIRWDAIADLYDSFVRATFDVPFLLEVARAHRGPVLELMCGTGRVTLPLAEAGVHVTAVDNSREMLARLREKVQHRELPIDVIEMDVRELELPDRYGLILIPFHSFLELTSEADQRRTLAAVGRHLERDGRFVCTLHNPAVRLKNVDGVMRLWGKQVLDGDAGTLLVWGAETLDGLSGVVSGAQVYEGYGHEGAMRFRRLLEIRFKPLRRAEFEAMAAEAGFEVEALYGTYARDAFDEPTSPHMIFVLRHRS